MPWGNAGVSNESYSMVSEEMVGKQLLSMMSRGKELVDSDDDDDSESFGMYGACRSENCRRLEKGEARS